MQVSFSSQSTGRATWKSRHTDGMELDMELELYADFDWDGATAAVFQVGVTDAAGECMNKILQALYMNSYRGELEQKIEEEVPDEMRSFRDDLGFGSEL